MNLMQKFREYLRIVQVARKPTKDEFFSTTKICAIGLGIIGVIGFVIFVGFLLSGLV